MHADHPRLSSRDEHYAIELAIKNGDLACARELVRTALAHQPSADLWYLAALVARSEQQRQNYLRCALALDPDHGPARAALEALARADTQPRRPPSFVKRLQRLAARSRVKS